MNNWGLWQYITCCFLQVFFFVAAIVLVATVSAGPMPAPFPMPAKDLKGSEAVYYGYSAYPYAAVPYGYAYYGWINRSKRQTLALDNGPSQRTTRYGYDTSALNSLPLITCKWYFPYCIMCHFILYPAKKDLTEAIYDSKVVKVKMVEVASTFSKIQNCNMEKYLKDNFLWSVRSYRSK